MALQELYIEKLVYGGDGLGHQDGKAIFVPFTAPGDTVLYEPVKDKKRFCKARLHKILQKSPYRVRPECPYFTMCGGCHWQHISYREQVLWKHDIFTATLVHHCGLSVNNVKPLIPSTSCLHYRSRARLRIRWRKKQADVGFFKGRTHSVIPVEHCAVLDQRLDETLKQCRKYLFTGSNAVARGTGLIILEAGDSGGVRVILDATSASVRKSGPSLRNNIDELRQCREMINAACTFPVTLMVKERSGVIEVGASQDMPPVIHPVSSKDIRLKLPPIGFSQINLGQNRTLVSIVMDAVRETMPRPSRILDLFCGMGNFTLPLAALCEEIHGVDSSSASIDAARLNAESNNIRNARFSASPVESFTASRRGMKEWDMVLLDPPRIGAASAVRAIADAGPPTIIYISCDPMTLSRDMKYLLEAGYSTRWSRPVDLFPHTYHIESITVLDRN